MPSVFVISLCNKRPKSGPDGEVRYHSAYVKYPCSRSRGVPLVD
jgi:hypothetical protein